MFNNICSFLLDTDSDTSFCQRYNIVSHFRGISFNNNTAGSNGPYRVTTADPCSKTFWICWRKRKMSRSDDDVTRGHRCGKPLWDCRRIFTKIAGDFAIGYYYSSYFIYRQSIVFCLSAKT